VFRFLPAWHYVVSFVAHSLTNVSFYVAPSPARQLIERPCLSSSPLPGRPSTLSSRPPAPAPFLSLSPLPPGRHQAPLTPPPPHPSHTGQRHSLPSAIIRSIGCIRPSPPPPRLSLSATDAIPRSRGGVAAQRHESRIDELIFTFRR
jgi:hypothetical protein